MIKENGGRNQGEMVPRFFGTMECNKSPWMLLEHRDEDDDEGIIEDFSCPTKH